MHEIISEGYYTPEGILKIPINFRIYRTINIGIIPNEIVFNRTYYAKASKNVP